MTEESASTSFAKKYRPLLLKDLIGQDNAKKQISGILKSDTTTKGPELLHLHTPIITFIIYIRNCSKYFMCLFLYLIYILIIIT